MTYLRILELAHSKAFELWSHARDLNALCPNVMSAFDEQKAWNDLVTISALIKDEEH